MRDKLTPQQAEKILLIDNDKMVHTFYNTSGMLVGGDHSLGSVKKDLKNAYEIRKTGRQALKMGHGIVVVPSKECNQSDLLFIETIKNFNEKELKKLSQKTGRKE